MEPVNPITLIKPWSIIRVEHLRDENGFITHAIITHPGGYVRQEESRMFLKADTIYVDREGNKVGPLEYTQKRSGFPWFVRLEGKKVRTFTATGCYHADGSVSPYDLVAEHVPEPQKGRDIDQVEFDTLKRGVARIWDSYKLLP